MDLRNKWKRFRIERNQEQYYRIFRMIKDMRKRVETQHMRLKNKSDICKLIRISEAMGHLKALPIKIIFLQPFYSMKFTSKKAKKFRLHKEVQQILRKEKKSIIKNQNLNS